MVTVTGSCANEGRLRSNCNPLVCPSDLMVTRCARLPIVRSRNPRYRRSERCERAASTGGHESRGPTAAPAPRSGLRTHGQFGPKRIRHRRVWSRIAARKKARDATRFRNIETMDTTDSGQGPRGGAGETSVSLEGVGRSGSHDSHPHMNRKALDRTSWPKDELREGGHSQGRRAGPRPRANRQLVRTEAVAVGAGARPIRQRPLTFHNRTLRGSGVNRTAARNGHHTIARTGSQLRGMSPNVPVGTEISKVDHAIRSRRRRGRPRIRNHACRQEVQSRCREPVYRPRMYASAPWGFGSHRSCEFLPSPSRTTPMHTLEHTTRLTYYGFAFGHIGAH